MATIILAVKGQQVDLLFDVVDASWALLTGQAANVVKSLRDEDGAAAETVTVVEQGSTGYYKASFTPTKGGAPPHTYLLDITEPAGTAVRQHRWTIQVYDSVTQVTGVTGSYLTTLAHVKEQAGITGSGDDALLTNLIARVSEFIKRYVRRALTQTTLTEYHDGRGRELLQLRDWPVISVTSVHESLDLPRVYDATTLVASTDYIVDDFHGRIIREGSAWLRGARTVKVIYAAGYAAVPLDLEQVAIDLIIQKFDRKRNHGVAARTLGDGTLSFFPLSDLRAEHRHVLSLYMDTRVA